MVGRGVLLDVARQNGINLGDGYGISNDELDHIATAQAIETAAAIFAIVE
jgi:hypothetical protein